MAKRKTSARNAMATPDPKAEAFRRLANKRVPKALDAIRVVGNLSDPTRYIASKDQAEKVLTALQNAVDTCKAGFENPGSQKVGGFDVG